LTGDKHNSSGEPFLQRLENAVDWLIRKRFFEKYRSPRLNLTDSTNYLFYFLGFIFDHWENIDTNNDDELSYEEWKLFVFSFAYSYSMLIDYGFDLDNDLVLNSTETENLFTYLKVKYVRNSYLRNKIAAVNFCLKGIS
jgi:hypothetical protein